MICFIKVSLGKVPWHELYSLRSTTDSRKLIPNDSNSMNDVCLAFQTWSLRPIYTFE